MLETLYRRPLPATCIAFSSPDGRALFREALAEGGLDGYFPLAEQFHTQGDPAFCGLGSLVVALNALGIDPGRLWKGPWRWFAEELLDCCVSLDRVRERGLNLDELACLARCNGAEARVRRAGEADVHVFRAALAEAAGGTRVMIASYDRGALGQTGSGHFSPIGGYHRERDLALVLDVARFKYPPHWVAVEALFEAMRPLDPDTGKARGFLQLAPRAHETALTFTLHCGREGWAGLSERLGAILPELAAAPDLAALARLVAPLTPNIEVRTPRTRPHAEAQAATRAALRALPGFATLRGALDEAPAEAAAVLLLTLADRLAAAQRGALGDAGDALTDELVHLGAQLEAVWTLAANRRAAADP